MKTDKNEDGKTIYYIQVLKRQHFSGKSCSRDDLLRPDELSHKFQCNSCGIKCVSIQEITSHHKSCDGTRSSISKTGIDKNEDEDIDVEHAHTATQQQSAMALQQEIDSLKMSLLKYNEIISEKDSNIKSKQGMIDKLKQKYLNTQCMGT